MPIVCLPRPVFDMLLKHPSFFIPKVVTPDRVRSFLKGCKTLSTLKKSLKLVLLEYCLDDLTDDDVCTQASNLKLLPLANGDFGFFSASSEAVAYFICDELDHMLLQKAYDRVIDRNIPPGLYSRLFAIAESQTANLAIFGIQNLLQLFPRLVPAEWKYRTKISWHPDSNPDHPSSSWFVLFWQYLEKQCPILSLFRDWPILPSTSGYLYIISAQSKLINAEKLPDAVRNVLEKIGSKILNNNFKVVHSDLSSFVSDATYTGVLESVFDAASSDMDGVQSLIYNLNAEEKDELRSFLLDPKWHMGNQIGDLCLRICKILPIYRVYGETCTQESDYSDLVNPPKYLPPSDVPACLLGCEFILSSKSSEEDVLSRYYGIERMRKSNFYRQHVFNRIEVLQPEIRDQVMLSILQNLPQLCVEDRFLREELQNLEFVPTVNGPLKRPSLLYDPRNEELYALLEDSDCFPGSAFQKSAILDMLQGLGLRTTVSPETILESARLVERLMNMDLEKAHSRGKVLFSFLEVNAVKWLPDQSSEDDGAINRIFSRAATAFRPRNLTCNLVKFWNELKMICWCPVLVCAPFQTLPWQVVTSTVAPPKLVRPKTDMWLVSASMRILDGECSSTALAYNLGWLSHPGGSAIAAQLLELGKNNEILIDQVLRQELALAMPKIYSILAGLLGSDEMDIVKAVLEGSRWIWVGDGFATLSEVVLDGPLHLVPYVRVIPTDLAVFRKLFVELGVREFLTPADYADVLCRIAERKGNSPLDPQEIRAAVLIAQQLAESQFLDKVTIYLPDVSGRLFPSSDLVYNDAPWLTASDNHNSSFSAESTMLLNAKRTMQKFVHGNLSNEVAEKLGARSLRRVLLAESADSMNFSLSGAAEAFGQHEALTTRLKHILEMYADGPGILFELVQNAEDAGASEVTFLLDRTHYGTSSLLSPEMADWQGPALYCFNNSVFTQQDMYAISRIGQGSKLEKPFAIGRFGLGFNCVYHFTDIPGFVSGENIVMFDPHANHLPGISPTHPGLRIKFAGRNILDQFPDQFAPFLHFGCDLEHTFPGTLFRFPLRNANVAPRSQIKKEIYTPEDVLSLFTSFSGVVSEALIFLRNVKSVSIFVKEGAGHEMQLLHRVCKDYNVGEDTEPKPSNQVFSLLDENLSAGMNKDQLLKKLSSTVVKELPYKCQKVVVTEQDSSGCTSHGWITGECLNAGVSKKHLNLPEMSHKLIPWASVAVLINSVKTDKAENVVASSSDIFGPSTISVQNRRNFGGRAFCFLPLPITTGLPAHINAYFELSSNRRDLWFGNDMAGGGKVRSDWNLYLIEEVVVPAYGHLLEKIASELGPCDLFFSVWPVTLGAEPWASLVRKLYSFIADNGLRVLYTKARGGQWISTKQAIYPDFSFPKADELVYVLADAGLPVINISKSVAERFGEACSSLHILTPQLLRTLLTRRKREFRDRSGLVLALEYCLIDLEIPFTADLFGLPLLPLADGSFTTFSKSGTAERIFFAEENGYELLKDTLPHQLVDREVPEGVYSKLLSVAQSEESCICLLSCSLLEKLFFKLLPADWHLAEKILWTPGQHGHPTVEWIRVLWSYLKFCDDLSVFSKWPILPVEDRCLMQLTVNSNVIQDDGWSENMSSLLLKCGCRFLNHELPVEHPQLERFVQPPTAAGILNALLGVSGGQENIKGIFLNVSEGELHELRNFILQSKWFSAGQMNEVHFETIKHLPIFESYRNRKLVSLNCPVKWLKPDGIREDLLDDDFVRLDSERERAIFKRYLQIEEPSKMEFYKACVLNRMSEFLSQQEALLAILHDLNDLVADDVSLQCALSTTPFVLAANGLWQQPSRLYDPRVPGLQELLHKEVYFPSEKFLDSKILDALVGLGLRTTLDCTTYVDAARSVSILHDSEDLEASRYGRRLFSHIKNLSVKLSSRTGEANDDESQDLMSKTSEDSPDGETYPEYEAGSIYLGSLPTEQSEHEFWDQMRSIAWCPICLDPPIEGIPWLESSNLVASPDRVRPKSQMFLVSATMHLLDGECHSPYLLQKLGWMDCLSIDVLCRQLIEISKSYKEQKSRSTVHPDFESMLQSQIPLLYTRLQEHARDNDFLALTSVLNGVPWVWLGDDFISADVLAFDSPVKFTPYLYAVPSELSDFKELLLELGVRLSFDAADYMNTLQHLQNDLKGSPLTEEQICFVLLVLEAIADCFSEASQDCDRNLVLVPDSAGLLVPLDDLVYNDAPWVDSSSLSGKRFVHPSISNDMANKLGIQSLRCISLVDNDITQDLPCMEFTKLNELLSLYGSKDFLLFDLLELADCCKVKKLHIIFDKREHSRKSLLQHNLGEFQGPALLAILEGATLTREEVCSLQLLSQWRVKGETLNYGLGLLSCFFMCDLLSIVSGGNFYMFDPQGATLSASTTQAPAAKMFSLIGTNLVERFSDQFNPMLIGQDKAWSLTDSTIIRMPLSSEILKDGLEAGLNRVKQISDQFLENASRILIFLKSVSQVSYSTWEQGNVEPHQDYALHIDSASAIMRNPFSEKKWRKFQLSRLFSSSNSAVKSQIIEVNLHIGENKLLDRWLVVLSMGSGQSRNMALDRRYLAYNLTPVAGVAAHVSRNGRPVDVHSASPIMSPLPLSGSVNLPVTILGCFLVRNNCGRFLFKHQKGRDMLEPQLDVGDRLIDAWNKELMSCVRDSYIEIVVEMERLRREHSSSSIESSSARQLALSLKAYGHELYSFWPRSNQHDGALVTEMPKPEWECLVEQVIRPFYARVADLPMWQLYSGNLVKAEEGMFLTQPGSEVAVNLLPVTVCSFVKEHHPVFSVPWELLAEVQAVGIPVREVKPKMVRDLLKKSSASIDLRSVDTYIDVLEYCLSDIQFTEALNPEGGNLDEGNSTSGSMSMPTQAQAGSSDAFEMMTSLGKALFDFGRVVVEDIGRTGNSNNRYNSVECHFLQALGVAVSHNHQTLVRFGLTGFESRSQSEQEDILIYLYGNWRDLEADSTVIEALREAKFVRSSDEFSSELSKPKDLFDPSDTLLVSVFFGERKRFPGERFSSEGWLRILRKVGLRTAAEADVILECAKRVEFLGRERDRPSEEDSFETDLVHSEKDISVELATLAGSVLEAIFLNFAGFYSTAFCNTLGQIACVPAESGFPSIGGRKGGKRVLTSYSEAVLLRDWPLAWSSVPILSSQRFIPPDFSWTAFRLRSPPIFSTVLKHLQVIGRNGGEDTLAHWPNDPDVMTVDVASCEVLKYLEKVWGSLTSSDILELQKVAFLPAANGTRLVGASSLFVRLPINLSPFAFELPSLYLPFLKILKDLGLNDVLSVGAAKDILSKLQKLCGYRRLNPNELRAVMEILHFLCDEINATKAPNDSTINSDAIVPDDGGRLVHARSCVYVDSFGSRYVKYIDTARLRLVHPLLPERICLDLGVRKLSDVVIEELESSEHIQSLDKIGSISLKAIRRKLQSESFQAALWTVSRQITTVHDLSFQDVQHSLQSAAEKIEFIRNIYTRFLLLPNSVDVTLVSKESIIPEWENESRHRTMYYINLHRTSILVAEPPGYISLLDVMATVVSEVLGFPISLPIASLFSCPEGSETEISACLRLSSHALTNTGTAVDSTVGQEIMPQDAVQVQLHPLRPFYKGEIVAWKIQQGDKLRYGRVPEDVRPSAGQALYRFKVEMTPGETGLLLSSQVFSFRGTSVENEGPSSLAEVLPAVSDNKSKGSSDSSRTNKASSSSQPVNETQYGRVTAKELVEAVHEMLSAAGINMELENQSLLQRTITLQEELKDSQAAYILEQERAEASLKEAETAKSQWICKICLIKEVDLTIVPCGHVLCRECSASVARCPFCRLQVTRTIRIFRP
ncbi:unnamed protein product [Brassica napus]|uniref:(rape) hypothetical protein n=1 Tax=Brassica napus TaxID=3708 RepID=A0A816MTE8_BRANA|nr:unnamed protein product [Brassica napus]